MGKVDELSRMPDWQEEVDKNNKDQILIRSEWVKGVETVIEEGDLRERIKKAIKNGILGDRRIGQ